MCRFDYTRYDARQGPIYKYIESLDHNGMQAIESGNPDAFRSYLLDCKNTICGRHPIAVFMHVSQNNFISYVVNMCRLVKLLHVYVVNA
jgi:predicted class III extradiol MEMO1 family dioxygenase